MTNLIAADFPVYPEDAKAKGIAGKVILSAVIGKNGVVRDLSVVEGDPLLAESAMQTVRHWEYRPTKVNGVLVEVATEIELDFGDAA